MNKKNTAANNLNTAALAFTKGLEVLHWAGTAMMVLLLAVSLFAWGWLGPVLQRSMTELGLKTSFYGFEFAVFDGAGTVDFRAVALLAVCGIVVLSLMAMVFRNVHRVLKNSLDSTPFQPDNIRMLRQVGLFMIAAPVFELVMSFVVRLVLGPAAEASADLDGIIMGILVLCLTQIFAHGLELEQDVDGLM